MHFWWFLGMGGCLWVQSCLGTSLRRIEGPKGPPGPERTFWPCWLQLGSQIFPGVKHKTKKLPMPPRRSHKFFEGLLTASFGAAGLLPKRPVAPKRPSGGPHEGPRVNLTGSAPYNLRVLDNFYFIQFFDWRPPSGSKSRFKIWAREGRQELMEGGL